MSVEGTSVRDGYGLGLRPALAESAASDGTATNVGADAAPLMLSGRIAPNLGGLAWPHAGRRSVLGWRAILKRAEDLAFGLVLLLLAAPVMAVLALAIRLDSPGPVIFRQRRMGLGNREFTILKFRTMLCRPEEGPELTQATRADPRVSRVGRILRRTSLDELPQLFNILRGDMSLVGPRPHAVQHHHKYIDLIQDYAARHRMRPGLTGWAQINGLRGETETLEKMRQRVEYDLAYIENWSLRLDLQILRRTVVLVLSDPNAF